MPGTYDMGMSDYLDYIPGYDLNDGASELLDQARMLIESHNYYCRGYVFPRNGSDSIAGLQSFEGQVAIPFGSFIVWMSGYSNQPSGFKFQLFDNGAKHNLFGRTFARGVDVTGVGGGSGIQEVPQGPHWVVAPMIIIPPGRITMQVTNLAPDTATIQVYMNVAVPIVRETLNLNVLTGKGATQNE